MPASTGTRTTSATSRTATPTSSMIYGMVNGGNVVSSAGYLGAVVAAGGVVLVEML
jgi:hypothetical protein